MINPIVVKASMTADKKILFIHHSTGGNLIREGKLRDEIKKRDSTIQFWDHNYNLYPIFSLFFAAFTNHKGLSDDKSMLTGSDYNIVLSNNSPKEYADIFSGNPNNLTLKLILDYDVIIFKNCYPTTKVTTEKQLKDDIKYYQIIRDSLKKYPEKKFILLTPPPERKETTTKGNAKRAKKLISILTSDNFIKDTDNLYVFDFYKLLADEDGYLKKEYTKLFVKDSHPNKKANEIIAPVFAEYLVEVANLN